LYYFSSEAYDCYVWCWVAGDHPRSKLFDKFVADTYCRDGFAGSGLPVDEHAGETCVGVFEIADEMLGSA